MRAAIYARISDDREGTGLGVRRQVSDCRDLAARNDWTVVGEFVDNSISAYSGKRRRPAWDDVLDLVKNHEVDVIVSWAEDRLTRSPLELESLIDLLEDTGCMVKTVTSGDYDLTTPEGRAHARIIGAMARQESERKAVRSRRKHQELREDGVYSGGARAFGWTEGRESLVPEEAAHVASWFQRIIDGDGIMTIVKDLNRSGVPTVRDSKWTNATLRRILTNPATAGFTHENGEIVAEGTWPGVVDRETFEKVQAILSDPRRKKTYTRAHLLTGLIYDHLGRKMRSQPNRGRRQYVAVRDDAGPGVYIGAEDAEDLVIESVLAWTDSMMLPDVDGLVVDSSKLDALEAELDELIDYRERDEITLREYVALSKSLRAKIEAERALLPETISADLRWRRPGALREAWDELSLPQQKTALREFIDQIVVRPREAGDSPEDRVGIDFSS